MELIRLKKLMILGVAALMLIFVACNDGNGDISEGYSTIPIDGISSVDPVNTETEIIDDELAEVEMTFGNLTHLFHDSSEYAALIDVLTGEVLSTFEAGEGVGILDVFNFSGGYFGLLVGDVEEAEGELTPEALELGFSNNRPAEDERLRYLILNEELVVIEELLITNEDLQTSIAHFGTDVVYESGQLFVYYAVDWSLLFARGGDNQTIQRYNVHTGNIELLLEFEDDQFLVNEVRRVSAEKLAFRGNVFGVENHVEFIYGFINVTTGAMTTFNASNFRANHDGLRSAGEHVLIAEEFTPPTLGGGNVLDVDRGEVIVFNVSTGRTQFVQLEGLESFWATLSLDGRYVVTIDSTFSYFRKYDIETGNLMIDQPINLVGNRIWGIIPFPGERYAIRSSQEGMFHTTFITIEE